jgi:hypothetical protein
MVIPVRIVICRIVTMRQITMRTGIYRIVAVQVSTGSDTAQLRPNEKREIDKIINNEVNGKGSSLVPKILDKVDQMTHDDENPIQSQSGAQSTQSPNQSVGSTIKQSDSLQQSINDRVLDKLVDNMVDEESGIVG